MDSKYFRAATLSFSLVAGNRQYTDFIPTSLPGDFSINERIYQETNVQMEGDVIMDWSTQILYE